MKNTENQSIKTETDNLPHNVEYDRVMAGGNPSIPGANTNSETEADIMAEVANLPHNQEYARMEADLDSDQRPIEPEDTTDWELINNLPHNQALDEAESAVEHREKQKKSIQI